MPTFAAVDLGATSGRVVNVDVSDDGIVLDEIRRFPTRTIAGPGGALAWDVDALLAEVRAGVVDATARTRVESVAVDAWGVDYGLLAADGALLGPVHAYRSTRTDGVLEEVTTRLGRERIYGITGIQFLPLNTLYQLVSAWDSAEYRAAARMLMVPDLVNHALCGSDTNDVTNASTTQLLDVRTGRWSDELIGALGLRPEVMPSLHRPGAVLGVVRGLGSGADGVPVVAAASHDTASAVAGTPLPTDGTGIYISCGTWALIGCERPEPITSQAALAANVTNEGGVDGTVRLLKNVTGLWLLEESRRWWEANGSSLGSAELVAGAAGLPAARSVVDPDDPRLVAPGDVPVRIAAACAETGQPVPETPFEVTRTIVDSLALAWRRTVATIEQVSGMRASAIHLVGGGSASPLLRRLCASACERPVVAGPVEATVVGNALVQAIAHGSLSDLAHGRDLVRRALPIETVSPESIADWAAADRVLDALRPRGS